MSQDELNTSKVPDPEVVPRAKRRRFSAEYKLRILEEADACSERAKLQGMMSYSKLVQKLTCIQLEANSHTLFAMLG